MGAGKGKRNTSTKRKIEMTTFEKSAIIGYWRSGAGYYLIGIIMGISPAYAEQIVKEYLKRKSPKSQ